MHPGVQHLLQSSWHIPNPVIFRNFLAKTDFWNQKRKAETNKGYFLPLFINFKNVRFRGAGFSSLFRNLVGERVEGGKKHLISGDNSEKWEVRPFIAMSSYSSCSIDERVFTLKNRNNK